MTRNPGTLGSGAFAATPAMVLQMRCTGVSSGVGWNVSAGAVGTVGVDAGENVSLLLGVPVAPAWGACVGARLREATFSAPHWGSRNYWSTWTYKSATEDASALMLTRI